MKSDLLKPGIHFGVPRAVYEADPGINQSALKAFAAAKTPAHFKWLRDNPPEKDMDYLRIGTALDTLIWSPSEFANRIAVAPETYPCKPTPKDPRTEKPWTLKSDWCAEWKIARESEGKIVIDEDERKRVRGMLDGLLEHPDVPGILQNCERHVVLIANHPTLGCRMKGELDLWPNAHSKALGRWYFELKSDGEGADDATFHDKCFRLGYVKQVAFYLTLARLAGFTETDGCGIVVVESNAPHKCKVHYANWDDREVTMERAWIEEWLPQYADCLENDDWPGYSSDWSRIRYRKPWMFRTGEEPTTDALI